MSIAWPRVLVWALVWGGVLGGVVFFVGFVGGLILFRGSNMAPILGFLLAPAAFLLGLLGGALAAMVPRWTNRHVALLLTAATALCALPLLGYMWVNRSQDDSEVLGERINRAARELLDSERDEEIVLFQPPEEAGPYEILIGGAETPSWITEEHQGGLSVDYPDTGKGPTWGNGRSWALRARVEVPVTLRIEKEAGEPTEIVLRRRYGGVELVGLR